MFVAIVSAKEAAVAIKEMLRRDIVDRSMRIQKDGDEVVIPAVSGLLPDDISGRFDIRIEERADRRRFVRESPIVEIRNDLAEQGLDRAIIERLPDNWEMLGDVLIIKFPEELMPSKKIIAEAYANVLSAKSVLRDLGAIHGEGRQPEMELLLGTDTEATHLENGVLYSLDAANIMFSSGSLITSTSPSISQLFGSLSIIALSRPCSARSFPISTIGLSLTNRLLSARSSILISNRSLMSSGRSPLVTGTTTSSPSL